MKYIIYLFFRKRKKAVAHWKKYCSKCGEIKPLEDFKIIKDYRETICKKCSSINRKKYSEQNKERRKKYSEQDKERLRKKAEKRRRSKGILPRVLLSDEQKKERRKKYYEQNKERFIQEAEERRRSKGMLKRVILSDEDRKERRRDTSRRWNIKNKEKLKECSRKYYQENK